MSETLCKECGNETNGNIKDSIMCNDCYKWVHSKCCRIKSSESLSKLGSRRNTWFCDQCKAAVSSCDLKKILTDQCKVTNDGIKSINSRLNKIDEFIKSQESEMKNRKKEIETINQDLTNVNSKIGENSQLIVKLVDRISYLENHTHKLENTIILLQQRSRINNIEIMGIPVTKNENCVTIITEIAKLAHIEMTPSDIEVAHRVTPMDKNRTPSIVAQLSSRKNKNKLLQIFRKTKLLASQLNPNFESTEINIFCHLAPAVKNILFETKEYSKIAGIKYVWTNNDGVILARKDTGEKFYTIRNLDDLNKLKEIYPKIEKAEEEAEETV